MVNQVVCVCLVCLICTTHTCSGHDDEVKRSSSREVGQLSADELLEAFFKIYGNGRRVSREGLEKILEHLDQVESDELDRESLKPAHEFPGEKNNETALTCVHRDKLYDSIKRRMNYNETTIDEDSSHSFDHYCPALLLRSILGSCIEASEPTTTNNNSSYDFYSWMYSILAVIIISACGILGLAVIPVMQKRFYQPLLQFLVALAVGTLAGDALLHLLPHAMSSGHEHGHHEERHHDHSHDDNTLKGVVAMCGLILFFCMERLIMLISKWRKQKQLKDKLPTRLKVIKPESSTKLTNATDKQCIHKYSSFPYCYDEIKKELQSQLDDKEGNARNQQLKNEAVKALINGQQTHLKNGSDSSIDNHLDFPDHKPSNGTLADDNDDARSTNKNKKVVASIQDDAESIEYTVILREHENPHHGHSHTHGHVHAAPNSITSVAWMVIMGDGLHNFTDGMAIGAAFANSTAGGFSTAVAVFCHELPHELGDFAMLLKAGMSMKQALFYNMLSSILCLFGNIFGLWLGNTEEASTWIFAAAAGMFLYIALVDMIPELTTAHASEDNLLQGTLHLVGLLLGFGIMALIAIYEDDLKSIFNEDR